jgi:hypothetical protein
MTDWEKAVIAAAQRADAFNPTQIVEILQEDQPPLDQLDDVCDQLRWDYPCLFKSQVGQR